VWFLVGSGLEALDSPCMTGPLPELVLSAERFAPWGRRVGRLEWALLSALHGGYRWHGSPTAPSK
jgi:hypothetical protein